MTSALSVTDELFFAREGATLGLDSAQRITRDALREADDFAEYGRRLAHVQAETAMLEERWLQLQTELESLQAGA